MTTIRVNIPLDCPPYRHCNLCGSLTSPVWDARYCRGCKRAATQADYLDRPWEKVEAMKREAAQVIKGKGKYPGHPEPLLAGRECMQELLGDPWWDDGKPRQLCTLTIELVGDQVAIKVVDAENRRSMHTTAQTVAEAIELLDNHLKAGGAPWRSWGPQKGR